MNFVSSMSLYYLSFALLLDFLKSMTHAYTVVDSPKSSIFLCND